MLSENTKLQIRNQLGVELDCALQVVSAQDEGLPVDIVVGFCALARMDDVERLKRGQEVVTIREPCYAKYTAIGF